VVISCGLLALNPPAIKCKKPVINKDGKRRKTVTHPDCLIIDETNYARIAVVEVTSGLGDNLSKTAQIAVVQQARHELDCKIPYFIINRLNLEKLKILKPREQLGYLVSIFGWNA